LASRQGFGELKTEQLGGHSQEQQRHRQAPIDDDDNTLAFFVILTAEEVRNKSMLLDPILRSIFWVWGPHFGDSILTMGSAFWDPIFSFCY